MHLPPAPANCSAILRSVEWSLSFHSAKPQASIAPPSLAVLHSAKGDSCIRLHLHPTTPACCRSRFCRRQRSAVRLLPRQTFPTSATPWLKRAYMRTVLQLKGVPDFHHRQEGFHPEWKSPSDSLAPQTLHRWH